MQYIVNQQTFFIDIKWIIQTSNTKSYSHASKTRYTRILKKYFQDLNCEIINNIKMKYMEGYFYLYDIATKTERLKSYMGIKQHYFTANNGLIVKLTWNGAITDIEQAVKILHLKMKKLKNKYPIIGELNIFIAGKDYTYNTIGNKDIVKDNINEEQVNDGE